MKQETTVIFNDTCPICSREVAGYRRLAERDGLAVGFAGLEDARAWGLSQDDAAREFHVVRDGRLLAGLDAFLALWRELPGWRWLGRIVALPGIRQIARVAYDRVAAPLLYALHRRRVARSR